MAELLDLGFYYRPDVLGLQWDDRRSAALVNPEWLQRDRPSVESQIALLPSMDGHLWVATSGASSLVPGHIRWVALSKAAFLASAQAVNAHLQATASDVWAHALPVFHVGGLGMLARAHLSRAHIVDGVAGRWDARRFQHRVEETHATLTALVPSQVHDLVGARLHAPGSLRAVIVGGARLDPELCADARGLGWPCLPSYGLTETCSQVATASLDAALAADCRAPLPVLGHAEIRASADGRLAIRSTSLLSSYAEVADRKVRSWDPKEDGWLVTEDMGRVSPAGVEVLGRASDSVRVLGEMVSLSRVEETVQRWKGSEPALAASQLDAAVVALPHGRLGHELVAVLAGEERARLEPLTATVLEPSLEAFCRHALFGYERPQRLVWVDAIPRTALGKCQRQQLASLVAPRE